MVTIDTLKTFYQDIGKLIDLLSDHPFTVLLIIGFVILLTSLMIINNRNNYTRIVRMIDQGEREAIEKRVEEWGEMILNNIQQDCMERKLALTLYVFLLPVFSILLITFSIYKMDMLTNLIITVIHLLVVFIIFLIVRAIGKKNRIKRKKQSQSIVKNILNNTDNERNN